MNWPPEQIWQGEDVFILGGGPSVSHFPLTRLIDPKVIGCNNAYLFGESIVDVLVFGDKPWWDYHEGRPVFRSFTNPIFSNAPKLEDESRIIWTPRETHGFHKHALGWNGNTGSSAINLALIMGASRVFLVGFDMKSSEEGESNWHENTLDAPTDVHYNRYQAEIKDSMSMLHANWPGVDVINLNPDSAMEIFPRCSWEEIFGKEN